MKKNKRYICGDFACEVRADGQSPVIVGYAAKFNSRSELIMGLFYESIAPGAFANTLATDDIRALVDHDPGKIIGRNKAGTLRMSEDNVGLRVEIEPPDTQLGRDIITSIKRRDITGMSFMFDTIRDQWTFDEKQPAQRQLLEVKLYDVSVVTFPAYPATEVNVRAVEEVKRVMTAAPVGMLRRRVQLAERL